MAKRTYPAMLEPAEHGGYGVSFPDLPGCVSFGDDLDHAVSQAQEALNLHLEGLAEDGDELPPASSLSDVFLEPGLPKNIVWVLIVGDEPEGAERVNVYLPKSLLAQIERFGQTSGVDNRSTFIRLASRQYLAAELGKANKIPRLHAEIRWETNSKLKIEDAMVYDQRTGKDNDRYGASNGACCAGWMVNGDPRYTPEGVFADMVKAGFANDVALAVTLNEFSKIEGCEWAAAMAGAITTGIKSDAAGQAHWKEAAAARRDRPPHERRSGSSPSVD